MVSLIPFQSSKILISFLEPQPSDQIFSCSIVLVKHVSLFSHLIQLSHAFRCLVNKKKILTIFGHKQVFDRFLHFRQQKIAHEKRQPIRCSNINVIQQQYPYVIAGSVSSTFAKDCSFVFNHGTFCVTKTVLE